MDFRRRFLITASIAFSVIALGSCATPRKGGTHGTSENREIHGPPSPGEKAGDEIYGPTVSEGTQPFPPPSAMAPIVANPDRIVLVLGPGLAHGYAYVGVIKALAELKIPIHAIYATEVGALAGALYYTQPNPNRIDWALLRFNEKNLQKTSGGLSILKLKSPEAELEQKLQEVFDGKRVETYSERLHILLEDEKTGEKLEAKSGDLASAVRGALSGANGFSAVSFEGRNVRASTRRMSDEYRIARQAEGYPIVVAIAGAPPPELFRKLIEEQRSTLVYVPLPGIDNRDLKKRNQAVFAGKSAVQKAANELLGLVGRKLQ